MKKWIGLLLTCAMLLSILAGCSNNNDNNGAGGSSPDAGNGKAVELTFWGDWGGEGQKQFETMADAFNKSQDKIRVKYVLQQDMITKFLTAATSGGSPDIMFWDRWRTDLYAPKNVLH